MLTIITTCGTSLLESSCWEVEVANLTRLSKIKINDKSKQIEMRGQWKNWITGLLLNSDPSKLASMFDMKTWEKPALLIDLPAELASLKALQEYHKKEEHLIERLVFIHGDSDEGLQAYQVLREVIVANKLFIDLPPEKIEDWSIKGLDPKNSELFGEALQQIWTKLASEVQNAPNDDEFIFNLTGGYKALSIVLAGYAYIDRGYPRIKTAYLYEDVESGEITFVGFSHKGDLGEGLKVRYVDQKQKPHDIAPPLRGPVELP